ncbi:MAG: methyltransferase domain-containing protein [Deltaproteobacteria bacterium]|nr:methyltransferase domain-containing protein [Deltaproteobacteria bacterium]
MTTPLVLSPDLESSLQDCAGLEKSLTQDPRAAKRVATAVCGLSNAYAAAEKGELSNLFADERHLCAYVLYYVPVNVIKLFPVLDELFRLRDELVFCGESLSVLDIGCGPGTFLLALLEYCRQHRLGLHDRLHTISLRGLDLQPACLAMAQRLLTVYANGSSPGAAFNVEMSFSRGALSGCFERVAEVPAVARYDLIIAGNVINEVRAASFTAFAKRLEQSLSDRGAVVIIDPGTKQSFRKLLQLRKAFLNETALSLFAPCLDSGPCPLEDNDKAWCHEKLYWRPPEVVAAIDRHTGFTKDKGIKYAYMTLTRKPVTAAQSCRAGSSEKLWRVSSYLIKQKGEERLLVCNGSRRVMLRRLLKNSVDGNRQFAEVRRGDLVSFAGAKQRTAFWDIGPASSFRIVERDRE